MRVQVILLLCCKIFQKTYEAPTFTIANDGNSEYVNLDDTNEDSRVKVYKALDVNDEIGLDPDPRFLPLSESSEYQFYPLQVDKDNAESAYDAFLIPSADTDNGDFIDQAIDYKDSTLLFSSEELLSSTIDTQSSSSVALTDTDIVAELDFHSNQVHTTQSSFDSNETNIDNKTFVNIYDLNAQSPSQTTEPETDITTTLDFLGIRSNHSPAFTITQPSSKSTEANTDNESSMQAYDLNADYIYSSSKLDSETDVASLQSSEATFNNEVSLNVDDIDADYIYARNEFNSNIAYNEQVEQRITSLSLKTNESPRPDVLDKSVLLSTHNQSYYATEVAITVSKLDKSHLFNSERSNNFSENSVDLTTNTQLSSRPSEMNSEEGSTINVFDLDTTVDISAHTSNYSATDIQSPTESSKTVTPLNKVMDAFHQVEDYENLYYFPEDSKINIDGHNYWDDFFNSERSINFSENSVDSTTNTQLSSRSSEMNSDEESAIDVFDLYSVLDISDHISNSSATDIQSSTESSKIVTPLNKVMDVFNQDEDYEDLYYSPVDSKINIDSHNYWDDLFNSERSINFSENSVDSTTNTQLSSRSSEMNSDEESAIDVFDLYSVLDISDHISNSSATDIQSSTESSKIVTPLNKVMDVFNQDEDYEDLYYSPVDSKINIDSHNYWDDLFNSERSINFSENSVDSTTNTQFSSRSSEMNSDEESAIDVFDLYSVLDISDHISNSSATDIQSSTESSKIVTPLNKVMDVFNQDEDYEDLYYSPVDSKINIDSHNYWDDLFNSERSINFSENSVDSTTNTQLSSRPSEMNSKEESSIDVFDLYSPVDISDHIFNYSATDIQSSTESSKIVTPLNKVMDVFNQDEDYEDLYYSPVDSKINIDSHNYWDDLFNSERSNNIPTNLIDTTTDILLSSKSNEKNHKSSLGDKSSSLSPNTVNTEADAKSATHASSYQSTNIQSSTTTSTSDEYDNHYETVSETLTVIIQSTTTESSTQSFTNTHNVKVPYRHSTERIDLTTTKSIVKKSNAKEDAEKVYRALYGYTVDTKAIISVLSRRTREERLEMADEFYVMYDKYITWAFKEKLKGDFRKLVVALMKPLPEYYADELRRAMIGLGTDEDCLIEILSTLNNTQIKEVQSIYQSSFGETLQSTIRGDTSGDFKELLISLSNARRDESEFISPSGARREARRLLHAGVDKWGTDETTFISIFSQRNYEQLTVIFDQYKREAGHNIESAIDSEFSFSIKRGLLAIAGMSQNPLDFFARRLFKSMAGSGTDEDALIRIIATRSDIDLKTITSRYEALYGNLRNAIINDTSGDYRDCLVALVGY